MNPWTGTNKNPLNEIKKADYLLITHGHSDHVGNAVELAKKTKAQLVTNFELGNNLVKIFDFPKEQAEIQNLINIGGQIDIAQGEISVTMTPALHSSGLEHPKSHEMIYGGTAGGFLLKIKNGPVIYHSGDTAYFKDLEILGENNGPDLALLNIGGHFGMTPEMAVRAAAAVRAKLAIPHHFKTFPILLKQYKTPIDAKPVFLNAIGKRLKTAFPNGAV
jgi:L-ascorbate metabolism protein UlaG (beta-lactamase superfamily)